MQISFQYTPTTCFFFYIIKKCPLGTYCTRQFSKVQTTFLNLNKCLRFNNTRNGEPTIIRSFFGRLRGSTENIKIYYVVAGFSGYITRLKTIQKRRGETKLAKRVVPRKIKQKSYVYKRFKVKLAVQLRNTAIVFHIGFGIREVLATAARITL